MMNRLEFHLVFAFLLFMVLPVDVVGQGGSAPVIFSATITADDPALTVHLKTGFQDEGGVVIDQRYRFNCKGYLVAGMFTPEPGKALFALKGKLVNATGTPLAGERMSLWPVHRDGRSGMDFQPPDANPEIKTDADGTFTLKTPAINEDFEVVVGFPAKAEPPAVCDIIPVRKDGKVWMIRLTGASAVIDLGSITVR